MAIVNSKRGFMMFMATFIRRKAFEDYTGVLEFRLLGYLYTEVIICLFLFTNNKNIYFQVSILVCTILSSLFCYLKIILFCSRFPWPMVSKSATWVDFQSTNFQISRVSKFFQPPDFQVASRPELIPCQSGIAASRAQLGFILQFDKDREFRTGSNDAVL